MRDDLNELTSVDGTKMKDVPDGAFCRDLSTGKIYQKMTFVNIVTGEESITLVEMAQNEGKA